MYDSATPCAINCVLVSYTQEAPVDAEVAVTPKNVRKRKTTHSDLTHGSFFLRVGAIGKASDFLKIFHIFIYIYIYRTINYALLFHLGFGLLLICLSFWTGRHDLYWIGIWFILRDTLRFALPSYFDRRQSIAPDDLHLYADVLYIHECTGKSIHSALLERNRAAQNPKLTV